MSLAVYVCCVFQAREEQAQRDQLQWMQMQQALQQQQLQMVQQDGDNGQDDYS